MMVWHVLYHLLCREYLPDHDTFQLLYLNSHLLIFQHSSQSPWLLDKHSFHLLLPIHSGIMVWQDLYHLLCREYLPDHDLSSSIFESTSSDFSTFLPISMATRQAFLLIFFFPSTLYLLPTMVAANALFNNKTDKAALVALKLQITSDPSGALRSWNDTIDFCNWEGVSCSKKNKGRVVSIDISSRGLTGYITSSIKNLTFLHHLNLSQNQFSSTIPPSLFRMHRLHLLDLSFNLLHGEIPYNLSSSFTIMDLNGNYISGSIPLSIGQLSKLNFLSLSNNSLTGKIPPSLGNLSSLQHLDLFRNQLEGSIPEEIGNHQSLQYLHVSANKLSGELPASIFNLSLAYYLSVAVNNFEGMIPTTLGNNLPNLQILLMGLNQLKGPIPASLPNASMLYLIDISNNSFVGIIPYGLGKLIGLSVLDLSHNHLEADDHSSWRFLDALTNCSQLEMLALIDNKLSGRLPSSIANLSTKIQKLGFSLNQISGSIPQGIGSLINLRVLSLSQNLLTGTIPETIGKLAELQLLNLHHNMLIGTLPSSIGNLTQIEYLYLGSNDFKGPIPLSIGNLKSLTDLTLHNNKLNGSIPKEVFRLPNILMLGLSFNFLTGPISSEIGRLKYLREFYFDENRLFGEIPSSISGCVRLESMFLSSNLIEGTIPSSMGELKSLILLDLSDNNLTGKIPVALGTLRSLEYLNFSFNHLVGEVPKEGIFLNATATSLQGNYGLCGGVTDLHLLSCPNISSSKKRRRPRLPLLAILLLSMAAFLLILFSISCIIFKRRNLNKSSTNPKIIEDIYPKVSYAELMRATNGFSSASLLGIGQYGLVYKGSLDNYGYTTVAVKVFNLQLQGASKAFVVECDALRRIRHRNLIKVLTCCVGIDSKGNDFMAIVFEFMPNGNLDTWLHLENYRMEHLDLIKRLDIAINIADALCYLHHECETPIIHCDLKPSNVLLDGDMVAHVGDFGLSRLLHRVMSIPLNDSDQSSLVIRGSIGYAAPEYGVGSQVSIMGDVYSFGVLLLELFTGRRPVDRIFKDGLTLHKFVEIAIPDQVMEVIDPNLLLRFQDKAENDIQSMSDHLISIFQLSLACSKEFARERISMADAAAKLHSIRDVYFEASL